MMGQQQRQGRRRLGRTLHHIRPAAGGCVSSRAQHHVHVHLPNSTRSMTAEQIEALSSPPAKKPRASGLLPSFTLEEVAAHSSRESGAWVVLSGRVYDFTSFLDAHPGGPRSLLRLTGGDATALFNEIHTTDIMRTLVPQFLIGVLAGAGLHPLPPLPSLPPLLPAAPFDPCGAVYSPFPSERFEGTGLEAFKFQWAASDWLLRRDAVTGVVRPPSARELWHVHRAKSHISPLDEARDWLHVSPPEEYVQDMALKLVLLTKPESRRMCYVTTPESNAAEQEVLGDVIAFVEQRYPTRFRVTRNNHGDATTVDTLTPGYIHSWLLADFAAEPLRLAGLLVQEDFYLLCEDDVAQTRTPSGLPYLLPTVEGYDQTMHTEDHPSGRHHIFTAAASTFSIDAPHIHLRPMSAIHSPYVRAPCASVTARRTAQMGHGAQ